MEHLVTLAFLVLLQAVLGFDNLLYISLESKRVAPEYQAKVRRIGITLAIVLRIVLLFVVMQLLESLKAPWFVYHKEGIVEMDVNFGAMLNLVGGAFILYTATKEILHMLTLEHHEGEDRSPRGVGATITWIVTMNLVFSFDSILSALALSDVFWILASAIVISGAMMILLADRVSDFLAKNRMYEVLGLFVLFVVGIMLVTEGGHQSHLVLFGNEIHAMTKTTFYFVIGVLIVTDLVQSRYQRKLQAEAKRRAAAGQSA